jgi:hypothetical protein
MRRMACLSRPALSARVIVKRILNKFGYDSFASRSVGLRSTLRVVCLGRPARLPRLTGPSGEGGADGAGAGEAAV